MGCGGWRRGWGWSKTRCNRWAEEGVSFGMKLAVFLLCTLASTLSVGAKEGLPFAAEVAVEEFEKYRADIEKKAADVISKKRAETVAKLEAEAAKLSKGSDAEAAVRVLEIAKAMRAEEEQERKAAELAARRWVPLMEGDELPGGWVFPKEPDGGWKYAGGELQMQSLLEFAPVLHEAPAGDIAVRVDLKLDPNGKSEKEQQAGIAFLSGEDHIIGAIAQAPGNILAYGKIGGVPVLEIAKNSACQKRFTELQLARVGNKFLVFARGKLVHECDVRVPRVGSNIALLANNAKGHFRRGEYRMLDDKDIARLEAGKPVD